MLFRSQVLEAIDLFREKDTRDELGLAGIRDAISDAFFAVTRARQTRPRNLSFIPFIPKAYRSSQAITTDLSSRVRDVAISLVGTLLNGGDIEDVIGQPTRSSLTLTLTLTPTPTPVGTYWRALKVLKFVKTTEANQNYHRAGTQPVPKTVRQLPYHDVELAALRVSASHLGIPNPNKLFSLKLQPHLRGMSRTGLAGDGDRCFARRNGQRFTRRARLHGTYWIAS